MVNYRMVNERILVRGVNWIGDAVMMLPALHALKKAYSDARISLLVKPSVAPLFEKNPFVDEIIPYEDSFKGIRGKFILAALLRKKRFSKAVLFQNAFDAAAIAFFARIPERIGYNRDGRGMLLTRAIPSHGSDRTLHHTEYYLNLLREIGIAAEYSRPWIYLSLDERLVARTRLSALKRPILGINPGAAYGSAKRWPPERFAEVANQFTKSTGGSVAIFGGPHEADIAEEINQKVFTDKLLLAGKVGLRELVSLISECDAFVTNDSGPMHIASAVGTPTVAIFGSTDPVLTGPTHEGNAVIKASIECSPCFERTCPRGDLRCMEEITPEQVIEGVLKTLPAQKAVFFDRDGTLCRDADYLNNWNDFELLPGLDELKRLSAAGFLLIGISNQSGIWRGKIEEKFVKEVNDYFIQHYGFNDFYYCPHGPNEACACRKPEPGMLLTARATYKVDFKKSYVVGDKDADMLLAKYVGAQSILVQTGKQQESLHANHTVKTMKEVVDLILHNGNHTL